MNEVKKRKKPKLHMEKFLCIVFLLCGGILSAQTYKVGDLYVAPDGSKGIVYYVFPGGTGGWIVALNDASTGCGWGVAEDVQALPNRNSTYAQNLLADTAGYANTLAMRNHPYNNTYYAAAKVNFANGWVLPSPGQLSILFGQLPFITTAIINAGGTALATNDYYWSSAEYSATNAWRIYFGTGSFNNGTKSINARVRAVRSFSMIPMTNNTEYSYSWSTGDTTSSITFSPTQTTTYTITVSTPGGYSDTAQQTIVVGEPSVYEFDMVSDTPYEWNGVIYNETGDYTQTFTNAEGCDSVVTLHLTVNNSIDATIIVSADTICEGGEVTLQVLTAGAPSNIQVPPIAVGDILCSDGTTVKPADYANSGKTAMGVVFYVDNTGEHGWAVHLRYQHVFIQWTSSMDAFTDIPTLMNYSTSRTAINDFDGYNNTQKIRNAGNADTYPAAYAVDFANGWYIPAAGQLRQLFDEIVEVRASLQIVGGDLLALESSHWSSTEFGRNSTWDVRDKGTVYSTSKHSYTRLRSIRSF